MPERAPPAGAAAERAKDEPHLSRRELLEQEDRPVETPPIEWGGYLIDYLFEFGPTVATGMGSGPVGAVELESWGRLTGIELQPWEARTLLRLSREYLAESHKASERDCPAPWESEAYQPDRLLAAIDQRNALRRLAQL